MMRFEDISYFLLLVIPLALTVLLVSYLVWRRKSMQRYSDTHLRDLSFKSYSNKRYYLKYAFLLSGIVLLVFAAANLQVGGKTKELKSKGVELMVAIDVSRSMLAEDIEPNRLSHAKLAINRLTKRLKGDRIGVVVFAGDAFIQVPITSDYAAVSSFMSFIEPGIIPVQGTSFKAALKECAKAFKEDSKYGKAIVVISDGEDHEEGSLDVASDLLEQGIRIYTIGMGSKEGVPIPLYRNGRKADYVKDRNGQTVVSAMNPKVLSDIAIAGGGKYLSARNTSASLDLLLTDLKAMEQKEFEAKVFTDYESKFQYFLLPAILFLFLYGLIWERKSKWA